MVAASIPHESYRHSERSKKPFNPKSERMSDEQAAFNAQLALSLLAVKDRDAECIAGVDVLVRTTSANDGVIYSKFETQYAHNTLAQAEKSKEPPVPLVS